MRWLCQKSHRNTKKGEKKRIKGKNIICPVLRWEKRSPTSENDWEAVSVEENKVDSV